MKNKKSASPVRSYNSIAWVDLLGVFVRRDNIESVKWEAGRLYVRLVSGELWSFDGKEARQVLRTLGFNQP